MAENNRKMTYLYFANLGDDNAMELVSQTGAREAVLLSAPGAARRSLEAARSISSKGLPLAADNANTAVIFQIAREFVDRAAELYQERLASGAAALPAALPAALQGFMHEVTPLPPEPEEPILERGLEASALLHARLLEMGITPGAEGAPVQPSFARGLAPTPLAKPIPAKLRAKFRALARDVAMRCRAAATDERQQQALSAQASVSPDFFTCLEDLTIPILVQLEVEPEYTGLRRSELVGWQESGLALAAGVLAGRHGPTQGIPYATLHAFDYDGAFQVGARAADIAGLEGIATGLASFMLDRNYISFYRAKGRRIWVRDRKNIPQRYIRALLVTMGFVNGFASKRGAMPRFHGLGAGAPIALPLLALAGYGSPLLSVDSTAPEKNASIGKLFVSKPAPLTVSVDKIAQALVEERQSWDCPCPACTAIQAELPFNLPAAQKYYRQHIAPRPIDNRDLEDAEGIGRFLSLLWETRGQPWKRKINLARVNHSHWAMTDIVRELREHSGSYGQMREWVGQVCQAYNATTTPVYALQIEECLRLIDRLRPAG